jgi:YVTN family beta-propeller protein
MRSRSASLRGAAAVLAVLAFACAVAATGASAAPLAFIANRESNSLSVFGTGTNTLVPGEIKVGDEPASVAITPDGEYAYVTDAGGKAVSLVSSKLRIQLKEIEVGTNPFGIAITPDGEYAYVTDMGSDEVSVIETRTNEVVAEVETGEEPTGVAISPDGSLAYVAEAGAGTVETINTSTMKVVGSPIKVGEGPQGIEFTPNGKTAYVVDEGSKEVSAIETANRDVTSIPLAAESPRGIAVTPDGSKAYVVNVAVGSKIVSAISTAIGQVSEEIEVDGEPQEVAIAPNGETAYVTEKNPSQIQRINVATGQLVGAAFKLPGTFPAGIAITPDQSPIAAFTAPSAIATVPATFSGAASKDEDGSILKWEWSFGEGGIASGQSVSHTYGKAGSYEARLTVTDNEGCSSAMVFTGRTAYCSGAAVAAHPVTVTAPVALCSARFHVNRLLHNRKNGTVRMQLKLPSTGFLLLFGKKVHAITRKVKKRGPVWLTVHARVELNKRLKKVHRALVQTRITFTPTSGCGWKTVHRSFALLRAKRHHRHH